MVRCSTVSRPKARSSASRSATWSERCLRSLGIEAVWHRDLAHAAPPANAHATGVHEDLVEPPVEPCRVAQGRKLPPGCEPRLLDGIAGVGLRPEDRQRDPIGPGKVDQDEAVECLDVTIER